MSFLSSNSTERSKDSADVQGKIEEVREDLVVFTKECSGSDMMVGLQYDEHYFSPVQDIISDCEDLGINASNVRRANGDVTEVSDVKTVIEELGRLRGRV